MANRMQIAQQQTQKIGGGGEGGGGGLLAGRAIGQDLVRRDLLTHKSLSFCLAAASMCTLV